MLNRYNLFKNKILYFSFLFLFTQSIVAAGTGSITGHIYDKETKSPLPGANVIIKNTSLGSASDMEGKFLITNVPTGQQTLIVSYIGYNTITLEVNIPENKILQQDFYLTATALTGQTVTVTAQAQGQLQAINQQLTSNTIENVVSKARIQELPDVNAAESIGRLPGVSIVRSGGEATNVDIRGLGPKYNLITVNGIELPPTGSPGYQNGQLQHSDSRSVDLSLIPSNMLDGITLKKVVTADMDADVLGGTVDLKLKQAPKGLHLNLSAQGGYNALQDYYGSYNFEGSVSDRFFNDKLGAVASLHADKYDRSADKFQDTYFPWAATGGIVTGELQMREEKVYKKRLGASLLFDYTIPEGRITADGFYNQLKSDGLYHLNILWTPSAQYNTDRHWYQLEQNSTTTSIYTSSLGIKQDFGWIRYDFGISKSGSSLRDPNDRVWQFDQEASAMDSSYHPLDSPIKIAQSTIIDTNNTRLAYIYIYGTRLTENRTATQANISFPFTAGNDISGYLKVGGKLRWINRTNDQSQVGNGGLQYGNNSSNINTAFVYLDQQYPSWNLASTVKQYGGLPITPFLINYTRSNFLNGDYPLGLIVNQGTMNQITDVLVKAPEGKGIWGTYSIGNYGNDYNGIERYEAGYLMGEFDLGNYLTLIPGIRWEGETTEYHGQRFAQVQAGQGVDSPPAEFVRLTKSRDNSFWLPDLNLIVKPVDWMQVRLARTETLARPDYIEYAPISYVDAQHANIQAANSGLKPSHSTNYDASVSIFNNSIGLLAVDGFYKKVSDLIFYANFKLVKGVVPDSNLNIPTSWYSTSSPQVNTYMNNPEPAKYYGFSAEWQTHFWYLPSVLHGLVLDINYTHIWSHMNLVYQKLVGVTTGFPPRTQYSLVTDTVGTRMPDQPSDILNFTLGYDLGGFSARLSYLFQTDKLTGIGYVGTTPTPVLSNYTGPYARWDLSAQQKITSNIEIFLHLNNINARPDRTFTGSDLKSLQYIEYYGFTVDLGVRYNL